MAEYEVQDVVCDYGVYEDGELKLILNSRQIALQIVELLKEDERKHYELQNGKDYPPYLDRPKKPNCKTNKPCDHCFNWFECCNHYTKPEQCHRFNKKNKRPTRTKERGGEK